MTAHELARKLLAGPDLPVHQKYEYGDYWHTTVAPAITEVSQGQVTHSAYHSMDKFVEEEAEDGETYRAVILLD